VSRSRRLLVLVVLGYAAGTVVKESELAEDERRFAAEHRDIRIP
jgi:hypothetical protein